jgi:hypothetical protein
MDSAFDAGDSEELYGISAITARRMNQVTGRTEYEVHWTGYDAPTWEPASAVHRSADEWIAKVDAAANAQLARTQPALLAITHTAAKRMLQHRRDVTKVAEAGTAMVVQSGGGAPSVAMAESSAEMMERITPQSLFYDALDSLHNRPQVSLTKLQEQQTVSSRFDAGVQELRAAIASVTEEDARRLGLPVFEQRAAPRSGKSRRIPLQMGTNWRLQGHVGAMLGLSPTCARILPPQRDPTAIAANDDDDVEVTRLRRAPFASVPHTLSAMPTPVAKRHRAEAPPADANEAQDPDFGSDTDSEDDTARPSASGGASQPYLVDFTVAVRGDDDTTASEGEGAANPAAIKVPLTLPLSEFRFQYPQQLLRYLLGHSFLFPLPDTLARAHDESSRV